MRSRKKIEHTINERIKLAVLAGEEARRYLLMLAAVKEYPQSDMAWHRLSAAAFQPAGVLSELNAYLDEETVDEGIRKEEEHGWNRSISVNMKR